MSGEDAMYEMTVDLPTLPKGEPVQIVGLGTFDNGSTYTVTKDEADRFRSYHTTQQDVHDDKGNRTGTETVLGDTLLQMSKNMYGVEVSSVKGDGGSDSRPQNTSKSTTTSDQDTAKVQNAEANKPRTVGDDDSSAKPTKDGGDK